MKFKIKITPDHDHDENITAEEFNKLTSEYCKISTSKFRYY